MPHISEYEVEAKFIDRLESLGYTFAPLNNYDDVLARLSKEERVEKYIIRFLDDQSFVQLKVALAEGNTELAFRSAHTLKGVAQNL